jgi:hypothetical protein
MTEVLLELVEEPKKMWIPIGKNTLNKGVSRRKSWNGRAKFGASPS